MLMNSLPWLLQTSLFILYFQPMVCPSSEIITSNRRGQSSRIQSFVNSEPLREKTDILCDIFICDIPNRTGIVLFNNTIKYPEPEAYVPKIPFNMFKKPTEAQLMPAREIGEFVCLDNLGQARQKSYCNKVANYPTHSMLESMIKRQFTNFEKLLTQDLVLPVEITQRANHEPEKGEQLLCDTVQSTIFPKSGKTKNNVWMLIINDEENYKQGVRSEECLNAGKPCKFIDKPSDYSVTCKQNYRFHTLWAVKDNITIAQEQFKIPCCCQCVWKSAISFLNLTVAVG